MPFLFFFFFLLSQKPEGTFIYTLQVTTPVRDTCRAAMDE